MAPKRQKTQNAIENIDKYKNIVISDVLCPICRSILIEPVTLPCSHGFCLACFNGSTENTTLTCPLCRIRIGSWIRTAKKEKKFVNVNLWKILQHKFPKEIEKKQLGEDLETNEEVSVRLSNPGEIRKEYEIQLAKDQSEREKERVAECKASEIAIKRILDEEENAAKVEAEKLRLDEKLAKKLAKNPEDPGPSTCNSNKRHMKMSLDRYITYVQNKSHTTTILCQNRDNRSTSSEAYKRLLLTKTLQREQNNSNGSDSGDSIIQEMRYFKPIRTAPKSLSKFLNDGNSSNKPVVRVPAVLAQKISPVNIRKPNELCLLTINNKNSAFVRFNNKKIIKKQHIVRKHEPKFTVNDSGKFVKQYYNKKRTTQSHKDAVISKISPCNSPNDFRGFENDSNHSDVRRLRISSLLKSLSSNLNGDTDLSVKQVMNNNLGELNDNKNAASQVKPSEQERKDYEFALKLQEQLNNPTHREYNMRSHFKMTQPIRTPVRKRQTTLDELVSPKKFKI